VQVVEQWEHGLSQPVLQELDPITPEEVSQALGRLNNTLSAGSDNVPEILYKHLPPEILGWLATLFTASFRLGYIPTAWKHSFVTPHFKRGDQTVAASWRPVANPHPLLKTMGRIVQQRFADTFTERVSRYQSGFVRGRAMQEQFIPVIQAATDAIEADQFRPVAFLDIRRAYDNVWRSGLLYKLDRAGLPRWLVKWVRALLARRTYQVRCGRTLSRTYCPQEGLPTGDSLSCDLFALYYSDVAEVRSESRTLLNADDTLMLPFSVGVRSVAELQSSLGVFEGYCKRWRLQPSPSKSAVVVFRSKRVARPHIQLTLAGEVLPVVSSFSYLGVELDEHMTFEPHARAVELSVMRESARLRGFLSLDLLGESPPVSIVLALARARLYNTAFYASEIWMWGRPVLMRKIERAIAEVVNLVLRRPKASLPITGVLAEAGLPSAYNELLGRTLSLGLRIIYGPNTLARDLLQRQLLSALTNEEPVPMFLSYGECMAIAMNSWGVELSRDLKAEISWRKREHSYEDFKEYPRPMVLGDLLESARPQEYLYTDGTKAFIRAAFRFGQVWLADRRHRRYPEMFPDPCCPACPGEPETVEHVLLYCRRHSEERQRLRSILDYHRIDLTVSLLLGCASVVQPMPLRRSVLAASIRFLCVVYGRVHLPPIIG